MPIEDPSEASAGPSRRDFLEWICVGTVATAAGVFSSRVEAQTPSRPPYSQLKEALKARGLHVENGESLTGVGDFKDFQILTEDGKVFARMVTLEGSGNGYFDQIICEGDKPLAFAARAEQYETENPGTQVVLQVAGAFSCADESCQTQNPARFEPNGSVFHRGKQVGWNTQNPNYGGVVVLDPKTKPKVLSRTEFKPNEIGERDAFQTFTLVEKGTPQRFTDTSSAPRRALIHRDFVDASGRSQSQWAILNCDESMTLTAFGQFLVDCLGVKDAALLDTGAWSTGWLKKADGKTQQLLPAGKGESTNFTSLLVGVSRK